MSAVSLAESLAVSRGSFYWHFKSLAELCECVLDEWQNSTTDSVIAQLSGFADTKSKLHKLTALAIQYPYGLDRAIRAWANSDASVAHRCREVDEKRILYIESLLLEIGVSKPDATARAQFLYWSSLGRTLSASESSADFNLEATERITELLCQT